MPEVLKLPDIVVSFDTEENLKDGAAVVVSKVRTDWNREDMKFKIFTDGISNKLVGVYIGQNKRDMVLVRVYGVKTELIIDRDSEIRNMMALYEAGVGCRLYAQFKNGLAYEFLPGETLTIESVKSPEVFPLVARAMAKMHKSVDLGPDVAKVPCMWSKLRVFLKESPDGFPQDPAQEKRLRDNVMSKEQLTKEIDELEAKLKDVDGPIVFTHNDILLANIVIDSGKVSFIDYEYGDYNYHVCDIANHFDEMSGVEPEEMDFLKNDPNQEFRIQWIREYLKAYDGADPSQERLTSFLKDVNRFTLCYHMMWGLWGLVQARISQIDFDFLGFAIARLNEYKRVKESRL